jgi:S-adenosylmethionine-dependent methyltransferase
MDLTAALTESFEAGLRERLLKTYFADFDPDYLASDAGQADLENHVRNRFLEVENLLMPWLAEVYDLTGKSVLELGCGSGSATGSFAARAEQVIAADVHQPSLEAAAYRTGQLSLTNIDYRVLDPGWLEKDEPADPGLEDVGEGVDVVLMMAFLEHLTIPERLHALSYAFEVLKPGGVAIVYETPNRLGPYDWHSFLLPFFDYLPDDLALRYAERSPRPHISVPGDQDPIRWMYSLGRGVSYHEFQLALDMEEITVVNDMFSPVLFEHRRPYVRSAVLHSLIEVFDEYLPHLPLSFVAPSVDLVLAKDNPDPERSALLNRRVRDTIGDETGERRWGWLGRLRRPNS